MPKSFDIVVGIMMTLTGVCCFVCLPSTRRRYAALQTAGKVTNEDVKSKIKMLKLTGLCALIVGSGLISIYLFGLYD